MNILFYTYYKVSSTKGGTERITITTASGLHELYRYNCYSAYSIKEETPKEKCFVKEFCVGVGKNEYSRLRQIIVDYKIDVVISQGDFGLVKSLKKILCNVNCKIILAHHFQPGWETHFKELKSYIIDWQNSSSIAEIIKNSIKIVLYPAVKIKKEIKNHRQYNEAYHYADAVVLLSKGFIKPFMRYAKINDDAKFHVIPNSLSFNEFLPKDEIKNKEKIALIVSRLDDPQKRISLAIKIWREVKKHKESIGWKLNIIGHGLYFQAYQVLIERLKVPNIYLLGRRIPNAYYKESSIFLMTSKSEGWGLTLTEAQQMGVVPIAFDSYESLRDIITNNENGIVIPECDTKQYVHKILWLMKNTTERRKLAKQAIHCSHKFEKDKIILKWSNLISKLTSTNKICVIENPITPPSQGIEGLQKVA